MTFVCVLGVQFISLHRFNKCNEQGKPNIELNFGSNNCSINPFQRVNQSLTNFFPVAGSSTTNAPASDSVNTFVC